MNERRRHFRVAKETVITCQEVAYPLDSTTEFPVSMLDVSESGVKFDAPHPLAPGTPVQLALRLEGWNRHKNSFFRYQETLPSQPLAALGKVVRCIPIEGNGHEIGVEFIDIWRDHWDAMKRYLDNEKKKLEIHDNRPSHA